MQQSNEGGGGPDPDPSRKRRKGLLGGILGAAKATSTHVTAGDAAMAARTCRTCGAGRPEDTDLRVCGYCGARFMSDDVEGAESSAESADE